LGIGNFQGGIASSLALLAMTRERLTKVKEEIPESCIPNLKRRLPRLGRFATEVICDLWLVVCAGDGLSSELATSH
jgi:hypothetical protein